MKELSVLLFLISVVFITVGYLDLKLSNAKNKKKIVYRFVNRSVFDELGDNNITKKFNDLFESPNILSERRSMNYYSSNLV
jgi:hypothetical protein|tara:strand:+ start:92 stop:334 length:243 start_codon:yes stop_codon:yes gene_type:complete